MKTHIILYVKDQQKSTTFYTHTLAIKPTLNVPNMTEFHLNDGCTLGLMPETAIVALLGDSLPNPAQAQGIPRSEIYLHIHAAQAYLDRALSAGATCLSPLSKRGWGDVVAYCLDPDGHVLAFAQSPEEP